MSSLRNAVIAAAVMLAGSGSALATPALGRMGPFTATVTGAMSETLRGEAIFQNVYVTGDTVPSLWWITLTAGGDADHRIQFSRSERGVPAPGTYPIADSRHEIEPEPSQFDVMYEHGASGGAMNFSGRSGRLEITTATATRVIGRFTFTAAADTGDSTRTVTLTGSFTADRAADRRRPRRAP